MQMAARHPKLSFKPLRKRTKCSRIQGSDQHTTRCDSDGVSGRIVGGQTERGTFLSHGAYHNYFIPVIVKQSLHLCK